MSYTPTEGDFLADHPGSILTELLPPSFSNATGQAGTVGSILETAITLGPGEQFSFDWAFLGNDYESLE